MALSDEQPQDTTANPAPLGLLGFGMTTILLNLHNVGLYPINSMILGMGLFYGGLAQILTGLMEWKKGNTFGTAAFTSYGFFWLSLVATWVYPKLRIGDAPSPDSMGWYLLMWGILTFCFFIGTLRLNRALQFVFATLVVLFMLLALSNFTEDTSLLFTAGLVGIVCGSTAFYVAIATILNEMYSRVLLPIWPVRKSQ